MFQTKFKARILKKELTELPNILRIDIKLLALVCCC